MPDLLKRGSDWLHAELLTNASQSVTYRRGTGGGALTVTISATIAAQEYQTQDETGAVLMFDLTDFVVNRADLNFGSGVITPAVDDFILWTDDRSAVQTYELNFPGDGDLFEPVDASENYWVIHTRKI
tara:strand:- start:342 stop:725 length:384 start_codon:yes stop_codon:yes gene_type:complete